jgi:precorrin-4 methylase
MALFLGIVRLKKILLPEKKEEQTEPTTIKVICNASFNYLEKKNYIVTLVDIVGKLIDADKLFI